MIKIVVRNKEVELNDSSIESVKKCMLDNRETIGKGDPVIDNMILFDEIIDELTKTGHIN